MILDISEFSNIRRDFLVILILSLKWFSLCIRRFGIWNWILMSVGCLSQTKETVLNLLYTVSLSSKPCLVCCRYTSSWTAWQREGLLHGREKSSSPCDWKETVTLNCSVTQDVSQGFLFCSNVAKDLKRSLPAGLGLSETQITTHGFDSTKEGVIEAGAFQGKKPIIFKDEQGRRWEKVTKCYLY